MWNARFHLTLYLEVHTMTDNKFYWPMWQPIPNRPWRLEDQDGKWLRNENGEAYSFNTAGKAFDFLSKHGYKLATSLLASTQE